MVKESIIGGFYFMKMAFLGDIALIGKYDLTKNPLVKDRLKVLAEKLSKYDYVVGNLESPLTNCSFI